MGQNVIMITICPVLGLFLGGGGRGWHGMRGALHPLMHTVLFEMKHAHLTAVRFARGQAAEVGLTPARLDMLRAILEGRQPSIGMLQSTLWRRLCVSPAVVSRMVRALAELGFLERSRCYGDQRQVRVDLTERGEHALRTIYHRTTVEPFLELALKAAFARKPERFRDGWQTAIRRLEERIGEFRREFGIGLHNPWEMTEDDDRFHHADVPGNPNRVDYVPIWYESWGPIAPCYEADFDDEAAHMH